MSQDKQLTEEDLDFDAPSTKVGKGDAVCPKCGGRANYDKTSQSYFCISGTCGFEWRYDAKGNVKKVEFVVGKGHY